MQSIEWAWGLLLIVLTIAFHAMGVVVITVAEFGFRVRMGSQHLSLRQVMLTMVAVIAVVGLLLAALHGVECAIWAGAYVWLGALQSPDDAVLYSIDAMTTRGASGLFLQPHWRIMGALEGVDGMLLFGLSTAYIFAVMHVHWLMFSELLVTRPRRR